MYHLIICSCVGLGAGKNSQRLSLIGWSPCLNIRNMKFNRFNNILKRLMRLRRIIKKCRG